MRNNLRILLVTNDVKCRIVDSYKVPNIVSVTAAGSTRIMIWQSTPFVRALDILDMATPTEAACSGGSSETLEQWNLGTTSVCPGRSGNISASEGLALA